MTYLNAVNPKIFKINIIVKDKKPTSEAMKKAKAGCYQKKKLDGAYVQDMRDRSNRCYVENRPYEKKKELNKLKVIESYLPQVIIIKVTVDVDGVVVDLESSRRRRCVPRPLPSGAGSSPKDTQLSKQICASKQTRVGAELPRPHTQSRLKAHS